MNVKAWQLMSLIIYFHINMMMDQSTNNKEEIDGNGALVT